MTKANLHTCMLSSMTFSLLCLGLELGAVVLARDLLLACLHSVWGSGESLARAHSLPPPVPLSSSPRLKGRVKRPGHWGPPAFYGLLEGSEGLDDRSTEKAAAAKQHSRMHI